MFQENVGLFRDQHKARTLKAREMVIVKKAEQKRKEIENKKELWEKHISESPASSNPMTAFQLSKLKSQPDKQKWESHLSNALNNSLSFSVDSRSTRKLFPDSRVEEDSYTDGQFQLELDLDGSASLQQRDEEEVANTEEEETKSDTCQFMLEASMLEHSVDEDMNLCLVCFQHKIEIAIEPCMHSYCEDCVHQFVYDNKTCPLCEDTTPDSQKRSSLLDPNLKSDLEQRDALMVQLTSILREVLDDESRRLQASLKIRYQDMLSRKL